jgi:hypothetical protein
VDPDRGESPWRRGVRGDRQVLICPGCQAAFEWAADLDQCAVCSSIHLVRRLGEAECRDCGAVGQPVVAANLAVGHDAPPGPVTLSECATDEGVANLAEEVERALSRVLGPSPQRPLTMS